MPPPPPPPNDRPCLQRRAADFWRCLSRRRAHKDGAVALSAAGHQRRSEFPRALCFLPRTGRQRVPLRHRTGGGPGGGEQHTELTVVGGITRGADGGGEHHTRSRRRWGASHTELTAEGSITHGVDGGGGASHTEPTVVAEHHPRSRRWLRAVTCECRNRRKRLFSCVTADAVTAG